MILAIAEKCKWIAMKIDGAIQSNDKDHMISVLQDYPNPNLVDQDLHSVLKTRQLQIHYMKMGDGITLTPNEIGRLKKICESMDFRTISGIDVCQWRRIWNGKSSRNPSLVYDIRGVQVMPDNALARIYVCEVKD